MASRRQLNPAFASAHSLGNKQEQGRVVGDTSSKRLDLLLKQARATGKLKASNAGLTSPLPDVFFDLRAGIQVDLSLSSNVSQQSAALNHAEETLTLVDVSDNELNDALDERFVRFQQVQSLRFKRCGLTAFHDLSSLEHLLILDLSGNQLETMDLSFVPPTLQELHLTGNQLEDITIASGSPVNLAHLITLDISENKLSDLDSLNKLSCPVLRMFRCQKNQLENNLPLFLQESAKASLQVLDASHNRIDATLDLSDFSQLQSVSVAFNKLTSVPCIPLSVSRLDLNTNKLTSIQGLFPNNDDGTVESTSSSSLINMLLQDNYLTELDGIAVIPKCLQLQRLDLSANKLKTLPYQLGFLPQLQTILLTGNPLMTFKSSELENPRALLQKLRNRAPKNHSQDDGPTTLKPSATSSLLTSCLVQKLTINLVGYRLRNNCQPPDLDELVKELRSSPAVALGIGGQLLLDQNELNAIPDDLLSLLPNLNSISFSDNALTTKLPASLGTSCHRLSQLRLARNMLTTESLMTSLLLASNNRDISSSLAWSQSLQHLDLSTNRLTSFPVELLKQLPHLQILNLSCNRIGSIQDWSCLPSTLNTLDLSDNAIEDVEGLVLLLGAFCSQLVFLSLKCNDLKRIPYTLGLLGETTISTLKFLDLKGNPQQNIRYEILDKPCRQQLEYLANRLTSEQVASTKEQIKEMQIKWSDKMMHGARAGQEGTTTIANADCTAIDEESSSLLMAELQSKIEEFQLQLDNPSLSQAKRYALKKSMAMERSKLIREERRLGLRKC